MTADRWAKSLASVAFAMAIVASVSLLFLPSYSGISVNSNKADNVTGSATLLQVNGYKILIMLAVPIVLAGVGVLAVRRTRNGRRGPRLVLWAVAELLIGFVIVTGFSIGMYYALSALFLLVATFLAARDANATSSRQP